jgi:uncharacterized protein (TIGR00730 family)
MNDINKTARLTEQKAQTSICVFCGSSYGANPHHAEMARRLGELIGQHKFHLVFGGGNVGLMGETSRAACEAGASVTGILPTHLQFAEPPMHAAMELILVPDMQERKNRMLAMSDAFILLPGGIGTLDEFFEILVAEALGVMSKPIVLISPDGYYAPLEALVRAVVRAGFASEVVLSLYKCVATPDEAIALVETQLKARVLQPAR